MNLSNGEQHISSSRSRLLWRSMLQLDGKRELSDDSLQMCRPSYKDCGKLSRNIELTAVPDVDVVNAVAHCEAKVMEHLSMMARKTGSL